MNDALKQLLLSIADDKLMLGHRNSDWTGLGPILEEDIAFSALAQDSIAHAQALYELIAQRDGGNADQLAFGRDPNDYRCAAIVELSDDFDWALAIVRQFYCDAFDALRLTRLAQSSDSELAALAQRLLDEQAAHETHSRDWIRRLAGEERIARALATLAPHASMLLETVDGEDDLVASGIYPALESGDMFDAWTARLRSLTDLLGLTLPIERPGERVGGRRGAHTESFPALLDEMCAVFRLEPTAAW